MSKWGASETGILRKKVVAENHDTLLVFGYACKLFRDDEKAKYIDQGKHLIPWMGDDSLKIDRYDGRGALSDLKPFEASREGYDATRWLGLSESERKIEQLCDEERYYSLRTNEEEEEMYKEEELKRQKTNEFSFNYDVPQNPQEPVEVPTVEEEDRDYVPRPELDVPVDISIPKKEKENARIEKTALFVSKQGPQMEILIKTKQAGNPQFSFLNQDDPLYKYYKHVLNAVKSGRYIVESGKDEVSKSEGSDREQSDEHYLHPSLQQTPVQAPASTAAPPPIAYKPTADCAYSQLVNRIQGSLQTFGNVPENGSKVEQPVPNATASYEQQQQCYQYYYSMQYYEYYKQLVQQYHNMGGTDGQTIPQPALEQINNQAANFAQIAISQYIQQQQSNNPYAQLVSNLSHVKQPISTITEPTSQIETIIEKQPSVQMETSKIEQPEIVTEQPKKNILGLVHYSSDSEEEMEEDEEKVEIPPDETRLVIEKMASYVAKNGSDFENIVKSKGDGRFNFLLEDHVYHKYYKLKLVEFSGGKKLQVKEENKNSTNGTTINTTKDKPKDKKIIAPVSFSIKKPKEEIPKDIKSALPLEESDEDLEITQQSITSQQPTKPSETASILITPSVPSSKQIEAESSSKGSGNDPVDPILEMIDLTEELEERKYARRAEDKIKDKLAAAARERMALAAKDRALQLERRKKAAAFLKLKAEKADSGKKVEDGEKMDDDKVLVVVSDGEVKREEKEEKGRKKAGRSGRRDESESEDGEIRKRKSKKKRSYHHKRKRSRSRKRSSSSHKKSKKKQRSRRSESPSSTSSKD